VCQSLTSWHVAQALCWHPCSLDSVNHRGCGSRSFLTSWSTKRRRRSLQICHMTAIPLNVHALSDSHMAWPLLYGWYATNCCCWSVLCTISKSTAQPAAWNSHTDAFTWLTAVRCAYSPEEADSSTGWQARHLHVTVSHGFGGGGGGLHSFSQACLHVHHTFIQETDRKASEILPTTAQPAGQSKDWTGRLMLLL